MAFKCYCDRCHAPLYFESDVPIPQICAECRDGRECTDSVLSIEDRIHLDITGHLPEDF
jgi:hypothetical protein